MANFRETNDWLSGWATPEPTTYQGSESLAFQRWFKFKEAFSPSLVSDIIRALPEEPKSILDCCGGSGTTGLVAQFMGIQSWSFEVNPFLADVITAKATDYSQFDLPREVAKLMLRFDEQRAPVASIRSRLPPTFIEPGVGGRWLFGVSVAKQIERLRISIEATRQVAVRRLFRIALGALLIEHSNVRMDGKGRRYRMNWKRNAVDPSSVLHRFLERVEQMIEDIHRHAPHRRAAATVVLGDARELLKSFKQPIDIAIFSPPYPNSFDYTDIYNIELWMLGYFQKPSDNTALRLSTMRSHVQIGWDLPCSNPTGTLYRTLEELKANADKLWNRRLGAMVHAYFEDLEGILAGIRRVLKPGGRVVIVVGDSSYANVRIDCATILSEAAIRLGFRVIDKVSVRVMRASMQQQKGAKVLDEWLITLSRTD